MLLYEGTHFIVMTKPWPTCRAAGTKPSLIFPSALGMESAFHQRAALPQTRPTPVQTAGGVHHTDPIGRHGYTICV